jgi:hypothetical protein
MNKDNKNTELDNTDKKLHISDSKIYCGFVINSREPKNHSMIIHKFLSEKKLQTKTLNSYYDEDGECIWYIVSDKKLTDDDFLVELLITMVIYKFYYH